MCELVGGAVILKTAQKRSGSDNGSIFSVCQNLYLRIVHNRCNKDNATIFSACHLFLD